jgi:hypothetical protein
MGRAATDIPCDVPSSGVSGRIRQGKKARRRVRRRASNPNPWRSKKANSCYY